MRKQTSTQVTVVMYHFVRDLALSRYPEIKGLSVDDFKEQLLYARKYYNFINIDDMLAARSTKSPCLPPHPLLLTFDDGYIDHFTHVFPILDEMGIQGCFFPPASAVLNSCVLDVNKIHFLLASVADKGTIVDRIFAGIRERGGEPAVREAKTRYQTLAEHRFDTREILFIKRSLQRDLPENLRTALLHDLFTRYVTGDEKAFARELYMTVEQVECMQRHGMAIGSHGYEHRWLDSLPEKEQEREVDLSLEFLAMVGCDLSKWTICYPYGAYNESLLAILRRRHCRLGFTAEAGIAELNSHDPLILPRLDTNDLPKDAGATPNGWRLNIREEPREAWLPRNDSQKINVNLEGEEQRQ